MADYKAVDATQLNADMTSVADAIRAKGGTTEQMAWPAGFVSAVEGIQSGGNQERTLVDVTIIPYNWSYDYFVSYCKNGEFIGLILGSEQEDRDGNFHLLIDDKSLIHIVQLVKDTYEIVDSWDGNFRVQVGDSYDAITTEFCGILEATALYYLNTSRT